MSTPRLYVSIHITKAGGCTVRQILKRNFGRAYREEYGFLAHQYSPVQLRALVDGFANLRAVSGHVFTAHLPYDHPRTEVVGFSFIREPVSRFFSQYFFYRQFPQLPGHLTKQLDLDGWIRLFEEHYAELRQENIPHALPPHTIDQVSSLVGAAEADPFATIERYRATGRLLLLPLDRFNEACVLFERMFPDDFADCAFGAPANTSRQDATRTDDMVRRIEALPFIPADRKLYALAQGHLQQLLDAHFHGPDDLASALADFTRRNARRRRAEQFRQALKDFRRTILGKRRRR